jgi:hypothetical protein
VYRDFSRNGTYNAGVQMGERIPIDPSAVEASS